MLWVFVLFYPLCGDVLVVSFMCIGWVACVVGVLCSVGNFLYLWGCVSEGFV